jgi:hypothetical protein
MSFYSLYIKNKELKDTWASKLIPGAGFDFAYMHI